MVAKQAEMFCEACYDVTVHTFYRSLDQWICDECLFWVANESPL